MLRMLDVASLSSYRNLCNMVRFSDDDGIMVLWYRLRLDEE